MVIPQAEEVIGVISMYSDAVGQLLTIQYILQSSNTWEKWEHNVTVHLLFIDINKVYNSLRREVLYNILIEFGIPMNLVSIIKMCELNI
jgi:hypothetical protein